MAQFFHSFFQVTTNRVTKIFTQYFICTTKVADLRSSVTRLASSKFALSALMSYDLSFGLSRDMFSASTRNFNRL